MSRYLRPRAPGASIFFTVALAERGSDLLVREVGRLRDAVAATRADRPFGIDAFVVMPDHLHCVWTLPVGDAEYSLRWGAIKARFTMSLRQAEGRPGFSPAPLPTELPVVRSGQYAGLKPGLRQNKREQAIWQRRFWGETRPENDPVDRFSASNGRSPGGEADHIRDEGDYAAHVRYCWINPIKHGFVERAVDWPYSSIHRDIQSGLAEPEWSGVVPDGEFGEYGGWFRVKHGVTHRLAEVLHRMGRLQGWLVSGGSTRAQGARNDPPYSLLIRSPDCFSK